jgi:hypothetical protein
MLGNDRRVVQPPIDAAMSFATAIAFAAIAIGLPWLMLLVVDTLMDEGLGLGRNTPQLLTVAGLCLSVAAVLYTCWNPDRDWNLLLCFALPIATAAAFVRLRPGCTTDVVGIVMLAGGILVFELADQMEFASQEEDPASGTKFAQPEPGDDDREGAPRRRAVVLPD